jgi:hypothetical protein
VGFPIRKSADQSFFAAPRGLSQRSTSFVASQRQGIHRTPLRHLIALVIDTHPDDGNQTTDDRTRTLSSVLCRPSSDCTMRKTSLLRIVPTACGQAADIALRRVAPVQCSEIAIARDACREPISERSYLFTMSDITHPRRACAAYRRVRKTFPANEQRPDLVEPDGIEPTTSCLQSRRSPN